MHLFRTPWGEPLPNSDDKKLVRVPTGHLVTLKTVTSAGSSGVGEIMAEQKEGLTTFAVAGTYVGTVVGAGFATGQEILQFFTRFGQAGVYGVILAGVLFALLGAQILRLGWELQADSYRAVVEAVTGPAVGRLIDWVITFFLFGGTAVMMAGSGAVFAETWGLSRILGTLVMAALAGGTVLMGMRGLVTAISAIAPILMIMIFVVCGGALLMGGLAPRELAWVTPTQPGASMWMTSPLLYVSYNLLLAVAVLAPLGKAVDDPRVLNRGGVLGGAALGAGAFLINLALLAGMPQVAQLEVPMLYLTRLFPGWVQALYSLVLWTGIYTTAVGSLFGLTMRLIKPGDARYKLWVIGLTLGALVGGQVGFSTLVGILFPAAGTVGLLFVAGLFLKLFRRHWDPLRE